MDPTTFRMMSGATAQPVQITFTASTYYPAGNTSTTLTWNVINALSVSINQGIGAVTHTSSTTQTANNVTRTYTLSAVGLDGVSYSSAISIYWTLGYACYPVSDPPWFCGVVPSHQDCTICY